jgi:hypothetical protein
LSLSRTAKMILAGAAFATAAIGMAVPANAATLGSITNYAPGYVFRSATPGRAEVESTVRDGAFGACRNDHAATKSVRLVSFSQAGPRGQVTSTWECLS